MKIIPETLRAHYTKYLRFVINKIAITFQSYCGGHFYWWSVYKIVYLIDINKKKNLTRHFFFYRTNDAGNGIEIILPTYLLLEDSHLESVVWNSDELRLFLEENNFANQQRFRTSIYHIYEKDLSEPEKSSESCKSMSYPEIAPHNITVNVHIPELSQVNGLCLVFRAHVRFGKQWTIIDANYKHNVSFYLSKSPK
jgi:hypothetical protein